jgi:GxxExxY protein
MCYTYGVEMKPEKQRANAWSQLVIGAAIEVHRIKGPGLIESIYSKCFQRECDLRSIPVRRELLVPIDYKGYVFEEPLRFDFLVDDVLIVELKVVEEILPIHKAQLLSYMKLLDKPLGLLFNFREVMLKDGITRLTL